MRCIRWLLSAALVLAGSSNVYGGHPLQVIYLTSPGVYHDYRYQSEAIASALAQRLDVTVDVSLHELDRWRSTDFAAGYDAIVYNICLAANTDTELIANLRRQTEVLGVPALAIHCSMHSFRLTEDWWPVVGLKSLAHEHQHPMAQVPAKAHPILLGLPGDWTVARDELYINEGFIGDPLLLSPGEDGEDHVTAWLHRLGDTAVFGTTLGHNRSTIDDPVFQQLLANALAYLVDASNQPGEAPAAGSGRAIREVSVAPGIAYLEPECAAGLVNRAIAPCYIGCILNPLVWGDEATACKNNCASRSPSPAEMMTECAYQPAEQGTP